MTQEDKELLLKDLCARLPYGVICNDSRHGDSRITEIDMVEETVYCDDFDEYSEIKHIKPYLRPMSSMTEEEIKEFYRIENIMPKVGYICPSQNWHFTIKGFDWLNKKMFDYRNLIEKGLAIEVTKENNPYKE